MLANFVFDVEVVGVSLREFFFHGVHFAERERFLSELADHLQGEQGPAALVCGLADEGEEALEAASHLGGGLFDAVLDDADFAVGGDGPRGGRCSMQLGRRKLEWMAVRERMRQSWVLSRRQRVGALPDETRRIMDP